MLTFYGRGDILKELSNENDGKFLVVIRGEAGAGKTALLDELHRRSNLEKSVIKIDLKQLKEFPLGREKQIISQIAAQLPKRRENHNDLSSDLTSYRLVQMLMESCINYLLLDSTDCLQDDSGFWEWIEKYLIKPCINSKRIHIILAGRIAPLIQDLRIKFEIRTFRLDPLPEQDARNLIIEALHTVNEYKIKNQLTEAVTRVVLSYSFGHPRVSKEIADYIIKNLDTTKPHMVSEKDFQKNLCQNVVKPIIERDFFADLISPWNQAIWRISILDSFNQLILKEYLNFELPNLNNEEKYHFYSKGIQHMRVCQCVEFIAGKGDCLSGSIGKLCRRCWQVLEPEAYDNACHQAAKTLETMAQKYSSQQDEQARKFLKEAAVYRWR